MQSLQFPQQLSPLLQHRLPLKIYHNTASKQTVSSISTSSMPKAMAPPQTASAPLQLKSKSTSPHPYRSAISSHSLGRAWNHSMAKKLATAAAHGLQGIELFHEDLEYLARDLPTSHPAAAPTTSFPTSTAWDEAQLAAASYIHSLCEQHSLEIVCLQPFMDYEGLLSASEHAARLVKLDLWFLLATRLHTDLIQIPSNFLPADQCTGDRARIVSDLQAVADIGAAQNPPFRFAYEALCWGTHIDLWEEAYAIIEAVDRANFGMCLDTFNMLGRIYGDPSVVGSRTPDADAVVAASLAHMRARLNPAKVFYVEVVDAERMLHPLVPGHPWYVAGQKNRMSWSRNARLFPFEAERGAFLPVMRVLHAIVDDVRWAHNGAWISFELFNRSMADPADTVPEEHAARAETSWKRIEAEMGWVSREGAAATVVENASASSWKTMAAESVSARL